MKEQKVVKKDAFKADSKPKVISKADKEAETDTSGNGGAKPLDSSKNFKGASAAPRIAPTGTPEQPPHTDRPDVAKFEAELTEAVNKVFAKYGLTAPTEFNNFIKGVALNASQGHYRLQG